MRLCAYCKSAGPLTREEIFPKFLSEKVGYTTFVDQTRDGAVLGPVTVRDVCEQCNGVRLSALDNYVASLSASVGDATRLDPNSRDESHFGAQR